jgi:cell division septation protein DedD
LARLIEHDERFVPGIADGAAGEPHDLYQDDQQGEPEDVHGPLKHRRGLRVFVALIGLALAALAGAFGYGVWPDGRARIDEARVIGAALAPDKITPPPQAADRAIAIEEKRPEAEPTAAAPAAASAGVSYGPAPSQAAGPTAAAAAPDGAAGSTPDSPPQSTDTAPVQAAPEATKPAAAPELRYIVQLSSQRSEAAAQATSKTLQTKYADLLAGHQPFIRRSDFGDRGVYYRVQVGPLPTFGEANQLCGNLKKSGADCVVQKN